MIKFPLLAVAVTTAAFADDAPPSPPPPTSEASQVIREVTARTLRDMESHKGDYQVILDDIKRYCKEYPNGVGCPTNK